MAVWWSDQYRSPPRSAVNPDRLRPAWLGRPARWYFIPSETWIGLKNTGKENIRLVSIWNKRGLEQMLRCGSIPMGQVAPPISREEVGECYQHGGTELEIVQPPADKTPNLK